MASPSPQTARIEVKHSRQFIRFGVFELEIDSGELRKQLHSRVKGKVVVDQPTQ